jgi:hypothetical protein
MPKSKEHELRDEYYRAIGQIVVKYSALEQMVTYLVTQLIANNHQVGDIVTAEISFSKKLALLSCLHRLRQKDQSRIDLLDKAIGQIGTLEDRRNQVIHSNWEFNDKELLVNRYKVTARKNKGLRYNLKPTPIQELKQLVKDINGSMHDLVYFMQVSRHPDTIVKKKKIDYKYPYQSE